MRRGVKANVLFFDKKPASETPWTKKLWIYDLRTNMHFTLKTNPLKRADLDEFVKCFSPENRFNRTSTWCPEIDSGSEAGMTVKGSAPHPDPLPVGEGVGGRWRAFDYEELIKRDKISLDIFWLKDESLSDTDNLPSPEVIAQEIVDDLEAALAQFREIVSDAEYLSERILEDKAL